MITDRETGEDRQIYSYVLLEPKMPTPEFEIVSYQGKWMLHLKNADLFRDFMGLTGFELGVYMLNNKGEINTDKQVSMTSANLLMPEEETGNTPLLTNAVEATKLAADAADRELYGYAKADGCLDADLYQFVVYVPTNAFPAIEYTLTETESHLTGQKPEYRGNLSYTRYDTVKKTVNGVQTDVDVIPPIEQTFRLELYGVKKSTDASGKEITWHETIARKDFSLSVGTATDVNIGYYDAPAGLDLTGYEQFAVTCWYAASGQGDVYNYFDTTQERAEHKKRSSGFITDVSGGASDEKYYFHSTKLPAPDISIVCMVREPSWYVRLLNHAEYEDGEQVKVKIGNTTYTIDTGDDTLADGVLAHAVRVTTYGWNACTYWAEKEGCVTSDVQNYSPNKQTVALQANLAGNINVNYAMDCETYTPENGAQVAGTFVLDETGKLTFRGTLRYNSHNDIGQYYRYELYARDEQEQEVTLYLSEDILMKSGLVANGYKSNDPVEIVIEGDDEIDLSKYHDFHVAAWYAKAKINNKAVDADADKFLYQYFEISEEAAKAAAYDEGQGKFVGARAKGILKDISRGEDAPVYYYVAPLADEAYADARTYPKNILYCEAPETISCLKKEDGALTVSKNIVSWSMYPDFYDSGVVCDVDVRIYETDKAAAPDAASLAQETPFDSLRDKAADRYIVRQTAGKVYDWDNYDYYALVRVKDESMTDELQFSEAVLAKLKAPLPTPRIMIYLLGYRGDFIHLDNYEAYEGLGEDIRIYVELQGRATPYIIDAAAAGCVIKGHNIPLPYSVARDKHNVTNGTTTSLRAYAQEYDADIDAVVNES
ncbi:MAG: hypothetical protein J6P60_06930, partial [Lachnospiraceae bacterium]|nr:hypothetical protein [Lachnospiraceae bacterium]